MEPVQPKWHLNLDHASKVQFEKFHANHPREYASLFNNLQKVVRLLDGGAKLGSFQLGFFRSEGEGVYRIGQTAVPYAKESRLYVMPEETSRTIFLISIGTKETQSEDINSSKEIAREIRKSPR